MSQALKFACKVVLITGAGSGIGAATAEKFANLGASVALTDRNLEKLECVAEKCSASCAPPPLIITGDLTNEKDIENILESTLKHNEKLDILVNNAGIIESGTIEDTDVQQYDRVFNTNVRAMYHLTKLAVPHLIKTQGSIVNVSSVNGIRSFPNVLAYNMSKSAIDQMTRCVALELALKGVRVNSVNPGLILTNLHKASGMNEESYKKFLEKSKETHAIGRPGKPEEIAAAIAFLASSDASFIIGVNLPVDGGKHAMCPR